MFVCNCFSLKSLQRLVCQRTQSNTKIWWRHVKTLHTFSSPEPTILLQAGIESSIRPQSARSFWPAAGIESSGRALAGSKPGSLRITDFRFFYANSVVWNNSGGQRLQKCTFTATAHISELARALDPRRIVGSGDENARALASEGAISRLICKPVSSLSNHITFEGKALVKIICEPCFADYQSPAIGILRNKRSGEDGFRSEGKFLVWSVSQYRLYLTI